MPDQTARDAVASAIKKAREFRFAQAWRTEDGEVYGERRQASDEETVDAVLAALGIPPDTTTDTIHAGLWLLAHADGVHVSRRPSRAWVARDRDRYWVRGVGASPAAAVNALAAKLEDDR